MKNQWQGALVGLVALAFSACDYPSAVDMAPPELRLTDPPVSPGEYCATSLQPDRATLLVDLNDCGQIVWQEDTHTYLIVDKDEVSEKQDADQDSIAVIYLEPGVLIGQAKSSDETTPYALNLVIIGENAFALVPALGNPDLRQLAQRHPRLKFELRDERPHILAGERADIEIFLKDALRVSLHKQDLKAEPLDMVISRSAIAAPENAAGTILQSMTVGADVHAKAAELSAQATPLPE